MTAERVSKGNTGGAEAGGSNAAARTKPLSHQRVPALDGLRGYGVLVVMGAHFLIGMQTSAWLDAQVFKVSHLAVAAMDMFFVLSGYLITGILLDSKGAERFFFNFYMRRTLRIFPLYYLGLLLATFGAGFLPAGDLRDFVQIRPEHALWYWLYACNVLFALEGYVGLSHFWSLAVEEQFYMLWPLVVVALNRRWLMAVCVGAVGLALVCRFAVMQAGWGEVACYVLTPCRVDALALGAWLACRARGPGGLAVVTRHAWPVFIASWAAFGACLWADGWQRGWWASVLGTLPLVLAGGAMVLAAAAFARGNLVVRVLAHPAAVFFGKYSYCLYVVHPLARRLVELVYTDDMLPRVAGSLLPGRIIAMVLATAVSLALAMLSWRFFESPLLNLKRHFEYRAPAPRAGPPA